MYFKNRTEAGQQLAKTLVKYRYDNNIVMCLSPGAVLVGAEIAKDLHCVITLLLMRDINLPGQGGAVIGTLDQSGAFTYNDMFSAGEIEEYMSEYHSVVEASKIDKMHEINELLGEFGLVDRRILWDHNVIVVSDGLKSGISLEAASVFLKPVRTSRLIVVAPFASVPAVDRMHIIADEIHCLDVKQNMLDINHYYEDNTIPDNAGVHTLIDSVIHSWK